MWYSTYPKIVFGFSAMHNLSKFEISVLVTVGTALVT